MYPPNRQYVNKVLKSLLARVETDPVPLDVCDFVYEFAADSCSRQGEQQQWIYRHLNIGRARRATVVIGEKIEQISNGTTGMAVWQVDAHEFATLTLQANHALCELVVARYGAGQSLRILELGSGCGAACAVLCASMANVVEYVCTDGHEDALRLCRTNVDANAQRLHFGADVDVMQLDWTRPALHRFDERPFDLVIGSGRIVDVFTLICRHLLRPAAVPVAARRAALLRRAARGDRAAHVHDPQCGHDECFRRSAEG